MQAVVSDGRETSGVVTHHNPESSKRVAFGFLVIFIMKAFVSCAMVDEESAQG